MCRNKLLSPMLVVIFCLSCLWCGIFLNSNLHLAGSTACLLISVTAYFCSFTKRKIKMRDFYATAFLIFLAVIGRGLFIFIPFVKPLAAIVVITAAAFGKYSGFLCGTAGCYFSNFIFGQGPWTVSQMLAFGLLGLICGAVFFKKTELSIDDKVFMPLFAAAIYLLILGPVLDVSSSLLDGAAAIISLLKSGFTVNLLQAAVTAVFVFILAKPILTKTERLRIKYGVMEDT